MGRRKDAVQIADDEIISRHFDWLALTVDTDKVRACIADARRETVGRIQGFRAFVTAREWGRPCDEARLASLIRHDRGPFPREAKTFKEVEDHLRENGATEALVQTARELWNEYGEWLRDVL